MTHRRSGEAFEEGIQLTVVGKKLKVGDRAPAFVLDSLPPGEGMPHEITLKDSSGSVRLLNVINSIDTPVCHVETRRWDAIRAELPEGVRTFTISMDLPFALSRWQAAESSGHELLSAHRGKAFGRDYGVLLKEWRLLQRAVFVTGSDDRIAYAEYVADQMREPDYEAAAAAVRQAAGGAS